MKKLSALLAAVVIAGSVAGCGLTEQTKSSGENPEQAAGAGEAKIAYVKPGLEKSENNPKKILIAYFSYVENTGGQPVHSEHYDILTAASVKLEKNEMVGNNALIAGAFAKETGGDVFSVRADKAYSSDYEETTDIGKDELDNNTLVRVGTKVDNPGDYDTVILIYPIWWGELPQAVKTFLAETDLAGKKVIAVADSYNSGAGNTVETVQRLAPLATVTAGPDITEPDMSRFNDIVKAAAAKEGLTLQ